MMYKRKILKWVLLFGALLVVLGPSNGEAIWPPGGPGGSSVTTHESSFDHTNYDTMVGGGAQAVGIGDSPTFGTVTVDGINSSTATPKSTLDDSDGADGFWACNATDADDAVCTMGVDDSNGDDQDYIEYDGVNERVELKKYLLDIELGHASDTTIVRSSAGEVTIEGSPVSQRDHETCSPPIVLAEPDQLQPIADAWQLMYFPAEQYPYGVTITALHISTSATCTDALNFEEWSNNGTAWSTDATVEAITLSGTFTEDDGTLADSAIAADAYLYVDLPASPTDIGSYEITVCYARDNS